MILIFLLLFLLVTEPKKTITPKESFFDDDMYALWEADEE